MKVVMIMAYLCRFMKTVRAEDSGIVASIHAPAKTVLAMHVDVAPTIQPVVVEHIEEIKVETPAVVETVAEVKVVETVSPVFAEVEETAIVDKTEVESYDSLFFDDFIPEDMINGVHNKVNAEKKDKVSFN